MITIIFIILVVVVVVDRWSNLVCMDPFSWVPLLYCKVLYSLLQG